MERLPIADLETFVAIVEHGSLRAAARALKVQPPAVSYRLKQLEAEIGTPLLLRSTRSMELTEAGRRLLHRSLPALAELSAAVDGARNTIVSPRGPLRISLSYVAFRYTLADRLAEFHAAYPDIEMFLSFDDALVDLAKGGFHVAIRIGDWLDSDMIAVQVTGLRRMAFVASPGYLDRRGRPLAPADLQHHTCIRFRLLTSTNLLEWEFLVAGQISVLKVPGSIIISNTVGQVDAAVNELGIAWLARKIVERDLAEGRLEEVLREYAVERQPFFLHFPREYVDLKVLRALIDFLRPGQASAS